MPKEGDIVDITYDVRAGLGRRYDFPAEVEKGYADGSVQVRMLEGPCKDYTCFFEKQSYQERRPNPKTLDDLAEVVSSLRAQGMTVEVTVTETKTISL